MNNIVVLAWKYNFDLHTSPTLSAFHLCPVELCVCIVELSLVIILHWKLLIWAWCTVHTLQQYACRRSVHVHCAYCSHQLGNFRTFSQRHTHTLTSIYQLPVKRMRDVKLNQKSNGFYDNRMLGIIFYFWLLLLLLLPMPFSVPFVTFWRMEE